MNDHPTDLADRQETERLGAALARRAGGNPHFIASAFEIWLKHNSESDLRQALNCSDAAFWRLSVTPKPQDGMAFVEQTMQIATAHGANPTALVRILRYADSLGAMAGAGDGQGMLRAALDDEDDQA